MGLGEFSPWHLLIVAFVFVLLFGAKKLPDAARSLGRSLRIFKAEMQGLREDEPPARELTTSTTPPVTSPVPPSPAQPPSFTDPVASAPDHPAR